MEQQNHRFFRLWGPVFLKIGIAFVVSMLAMSLFEMSYLLKENGMTFQALQNPQVMQQFMDLLHQYIAQPAKIRELTDIVSVEFMQYVTAVEGIEALLTIPFLGVMFHKDTLEQKINGFIPNRKAPALSYIYVVIMAVALTIGVNNLIAISGLFKEDQAYNETVRALYSAELGIQVVCLGILIPICEEMVFRGLMFRRIRRFGTFMPAMLYSSFAFAFLHGSMIQMIHAFFLGCVFCYLYEKYGSVKAPILAHITANTLSVIFTRIDVLGWMYERPTVMGIVTVLCASVASTMYILMQRIEEKPDNLSEEDR